MNVPGADAAALGRAYGELATVVATLGPDDLAKPTCCPGWDVRGLLNHTLGTAVMFTLANAGERAGEDAGDLVGEDAAGAVARVSAANIASWQEEGALEGERHYPWGTFGAPIGLLINVSEIALHSWDVAEATGREARIDADIARAVHGFYSQMPMDEMRARGVFGSEVSVPQSAPVQQRLLGLLGRAV